MSEANNDAITSPTAALLPCPFCGDTSCMLTRSPGDARVAAWWATCMECAAEGPPSGSQADAVDAWNRRAGQLASIQVDEITEANVEAVENEIGMGRGAWDMVDHRELILACVKVVCGKSA